MSEGTGDAQQQAGTQENGATGAGEQTQSFTQADVDRIVKERVQRERAKYADYDELKTKASEKASADDRIADLEKKYAASEAARLRSDVAAKFGISAEDRDLFLTGADEDTLTAQAQRLAAREADRKKQGNVAPKEGASPVGKPQSDMREFTRSLFGSDD